MPQGEASFVTHYITLPNVVATLATYFAISITLSFLRAPKYPTNIPWMGHGKGYFAAFRNIISGFTQSKAWMYEGYEKFSKAGKTFVLPSMLGQPAEVIIPRSQMQWLLDMPDPVVSTSAAHAEFLHGEYNFVKPIILRDPYHEHVIHRNLARNLNGVIPELNDEVCRAIDELCGMDTENWKNLDTQEGFMMRLIPKITNRIVVGEPLCRNQDFLDAMLGFANDVIRGIVLLSFFPKLLHPIMGILTGLCSKYHFWKTRKHSLPIIKQRIMDIQKKIAGDPEYKAWKEPNDFITWTIKTAMAEGREDEFEPNRIAVRMMPINFASIHTTALTGYGTLVNIFAAGPVVMESLREEATRVFREEGGKWTKQGLSRMYKTDSAIRESQRMLPIALTATQRMVMAKEGITSPEGVHFEKGTILSCPWTPVTDDDEIYDEADKFDAFRFSREREAFEAMSAEQKENVDALKMRQNGLVTTSDRHMPFGHGRHACPGRFLVSHELKMIIAHLIMNYDIKPLVERPRVSWLGRNMIPPSVNMEFKRRKAV